VSDASTLIAHAERVCDSGKAELGGVWPRAAAALVRQALESHARDLLAKEGARVEELRFSALMLATHAVIAPDDAREMTQLWSQLSECLHHTELGTTLDVRVAVARAKALVERGEAG